MEHNLFKYMLTFPQETAIFHKLSLGCMDTINLCIQSATLSFNKHLNQTNFSSFRCFPSYVFLLWQNLPCVGTLKLPFFTSSFISFKSIFFFFFFLVLILPSKDLLVITVSIAFSIVLANVYIYSMNSLSYTHRTKPMIGLWDKLPWKDLKIVRSCKGSSFLWRYE